MPFPVGGLERDAQRTIHWEARHAKTCMGRHASELVSLILISRHCFLPCFMLYCHFIKQVQVWGIFWGRISPGSVPQRMITYKKISPPLQQAFRNCNMVKKINMLHDSPNPGSTWTLWYCVVILVDYKSKHQKALTAQQSVKIFTHPASLLAVLWASFIVFQLTVKYSRQGD